MNKTLPCRSRPAFSLIELMVAVTLLALLSGAAALTFVGPIHRAQASLALDICRRGDRMTREQARRFGQGATLTFDLRRQTLQRDASPLQQLPSGIILKEIRCRRRRVSDGSFVLDVSRLGLCYSYALHLQGGTMDEWLMFAGLSGEMIEVNEAQVQTIFAAGHDVD